MEKIDTPIFGSFVVKSKRFIDDRGSFMEGFNAQTWSLISEKENFVQDNISVSRKNVIRGMHGQFFPNQSKLVRCISGRIDDVIIDVRPKSPTFRKSFKITLTHENDLALFIPHGCLHGFIALDNENVVWYKTTGGYNKENAYSVNPFLCGIDWGISSENAIISHQDSEAGSLDNFLKSDIFSKASETFA